MKDNTLYMVWGGLLILCAALGFIPEPNGFLKAGLVMLGISCFLPPAVLLYRGIKKGKRTHLRRILAISSCSLSLTAAVFIANVLFTMSTELMGNIMNTLLYLVSSPMACCQYWVLSLFLWACLLMVCLSYWKKTEE